MSSSSNKENVAVAVGNNVSTEHDTERDLITLSVKELKERCRGLGLKRSGTKAELMERLENPAQAKRARGMTTKDVQEALTAAGYPNPENASSCAKRGIQRGFITLAGGLDKVFKKSSCCECYETIDVTVRNLLDQSDYGGQDYQDGAPGGAVQCKKCGVGKYLTGMCQGEFGEDSGKFHNHCTECPGFGRCIGDYREAHCRSCGRHYFAGNSGLACPCHERRQGGLGRGEVNLGAT
jgi:hypothetical protein